MKLLKSTGFPKAREVIMETLFFAMNSASLFSVLIESCFPESKMYLLAFRGVQD